jgi:hypothetical protein
MKKGENVERTEEDACQLLCDGINDFLQPRFGHKKRHAYVHADRNKIVAYTVKFDLYLRYLYEPDTLTIARIGFTPKQKGHGTALLKVILNMSEALHIKRVTIEQAGSEGEAFARAFGFTEYYKLNWEISIADLKSSLAKR